MRPLRGRADNTGLDRDSAIKQFSFPVGEITLSIYIYSHIYIYVYTYTRARVADSEFRRFVRVVVSARIVKKKQLASDAFDRVVKSIGPSSLPLCCRWLSFRRAAVNGIAI